VTFIDKLKDALPEHPPQRDWRDCYLRVEKINDGYEISYGSMYESPELSFAMLCKLSELFGTKSVDVDNYSSSGCESCDYGSDYGHTIQICKITENADELNKLVGKGDIYA
jgi:hypothetical protein